MKRKTHDSSSQTNNGHPDLNGMGASLEEEVNKISAKIKALSWQEIKKLQDLLRGESLNEGDEYFVELAQFLDKQTDAERPAAELAILRSVAAKFNIGEMEGKMGLALDQFTQTLLWLYGLLQNAENRIEAYYPGDRTNLPFGIGKNNCVLLSCHELYSMSADHITDFFVGMKILGVKALRLVVGTAEEIDEFTNFGLNRWQAWWQGLENASVTDLAFNGNALFYLTNTTTPKGGYLRNANGAGLPEHALFKHDGILDRNYNDAAIHAEVDSGNLIEAYKLMSKLSCLKVIEFSGSVSMYLYDPPMLKALSGLLSLPQITSCDIGNKPDFVDPDDIPNLWVTLTQILDNNPGLLLRVPDGFRFGIYSRRIYIPDSLSSSMKRNSMIREVLVLAEEVRAVVQDPVSYYKNLEAGNLLARIHSTTHHFLMRRSLNQDENGEALIHSQAILEKLENHLTGDHRRPALEQAISMLKLLENNTVTLIQPYQTTSLAIKGILEQLRVQLAQDRFDLFQFCYFLNIESQTNEPGTCDERIIRQSFLSALPILSENAFSFGDWTADQKKTFKGILFAAAGEGKNFDAVLDQELQNKKITALIQNVLLKAVASVSGSSVGKDEIGVGSSLWNMPQTFFGKDGMSNWTKESFKQGIQIWNDQQASSQCFGIPLSGAQIDSLAIFLYDLPMKLDPRGTALVPKKLVM